MLDAIEILTTLVRFPCMTGDEKPIADWVYGWATEHGLQVGRIDNNVYCWLGDGQTTLLLNSHLDVVPASVDHLFDPFDAKAHDGHIYGRGASDAKASGSAMLATIASLSAEGWRPRDGRLLIALTASEEGSGNYNGFEALLPHLRATFGRITGAIIGEPTSLTPCSSQKGLLILRLTAAGKSAHAARPDLGDNAIEKAARDIQRLAEFRFTRSHEHLGPPTLAVTTIEGGSSRNVIPEACTFYVDVRTTPDYDHEEVVSKLAAFVESQIDIHSGRYVPCATPPGSLIERVVSEALPDRAPVGSPTVSDWAYLGDIPGVKLGPGDSRLSHTSGERVAIDEVRDAVAVYREIATRYFQQP